MTCRTASLPVSGRRAPGAHVRSVGAWPLLVTLCALPIVLSWAGFAVAETRVAMSGRPSPGPIRLGAPKLSPGGRLAALDVSFDGALPRLVVFELDREELVVLDRPDNEGWLSPSFSPSGDRIAFVQYCETGCAAGRRGFQISIFDRESGAVTAATRGSGLRRNTPIFSLDGQSIVYGSEDLVWKEDWLARGFGWRSDSDHTTIGHTTLRMVNLKTGVERRVLSDRFGATDFLAILPSGFVDVNTLIFSALFGPSKKSPPLHRELKRLVGKHDANYEFYGYKLTLDEKLEFMSPDAPRRIGDVSGLSVSSDTGRMVFTGLSGEGRDPDYPERFHYDVFLGDGETFEPVTSLFTYMSHTAISKFGNRVVFLADDTRRKGWSLWVLDIETGQVRETGLKRRLQEWHRSSGGNNVRRSAKGSYHHVGSKRQPRRLQAFLPVQRPVLTAGDSSPFRPFRFAHLAHAQSNAQAD